MTNTTYPEEYNVVFQKFYQFRNDDADILIAIQDLTEVIETTDSIIEELQLIAELNNLAKQNEYYSGT